jgi:hypothetical protein
MQREGVFAPETAAEAQECYDSLDTAAQSVVREVARTMEFDSEEYDQRVTDEVVETARESLFASLLAVRVGTREEFDAWQEDASHEVLELGSEHVDNVAWHAPPFADTAVAATFQDEPEAAVETLRRQAYGRIYTEVLDT